MFKTLNFEVSTFVAVMKPDLPLSGVTSRLDICWRSDEEGVVVERVDHLCKYIFFLPQVQKEAKGLNVAVVLRKQETN